MTADGRAMPDVAGVQHAWHQAGAVRLHVAEAGEGPPVVLLHGWPQHWYLWREVIAPLAERYRVICPDLRGFGWSEAPAGGYDKETLARDVLALMDTLGVDRFRVAGHDWGGYVGFLIGLFAPERVERLLALNIIHPFGRASVRSALSVWRLWYQLVVGAPLLGRRAVATIPILNGVVRRWAGASPAVWTDEEAAIFLDQFHEPERARASEQLYRAFVTREMAWIGSGRYRRMRLTAPTLLLYGTGDNVVRPEHLGGFEPYADAMRVEHVQSRGHFIVDELPELVLSRALALFE